ANEVEWVSRIDLSGLSFPALETVSSVQVWPSSFKRIPAKAATKSLRAVSATYSRMAAGSPLICASWVHASNALSMGSVTLPCTRGRLAADFRLGFTGDYGVKVLWNLILSQ